MADKNNRSDGEGKDLSPNGDLNQAREELDEFTVMQNTPSADLNAVEIAASEGSAPTEDAFSTGSVGGDVSEDNRTESNSASLQINLFDENIVPPTYSSNRVNTPAATTVNPTQSELLASTTDLGIGANQPSITNISGSTDFTTTNETQTSDFGLSTDPSSTASTDTLRDNTNDNDNGHYNETETDTTTTSSTDAGDTIDDDLGVTETATVDNEDSNDNTTEGDEGVTETGQGNTDNKPEGDHDRGHGNDADGVDEDNPGQGGGGPNATAALTDDGSTDSNSDHDKGHGNNADGVDEDNPGQGGGGPNATAALTDDRRTDSKGDHDKGHSNDTNGVDKDNPGQGGGGPNSKVADTNDGNTNSKGDRGHGNDADGVDEDNPGRGSGGPNAIDSTSRDDDDAPGNNPHEDDLDMVAMLDEANGDGWHDIAGDESDGTTTLVAADGDSDWVDSVEDGHSKGKGNQGTGKGHDEDTSDPLGEIDKEAITEQDGMDSMDMGNMPEGGL